MYELDIVRTIPAYRQELWDAWTDPVRLAGWWWPERFHTTYRLDPRPGGSYRFTTVNVPPMGILDLSGTFIEVDQPGRLVYSWRWDDLGHETRVAVNFAEASTGTTDIRVRHEGFADVEDRDNHIIGWNDCLDRLEALMNPQTENQERA